MSDTITIIGNIAAEPESRAAGTIASFRVGSTQRRRDPESGRWVDAHTNWYNVSAFRQLAAHALQSLHKGQRVIVTGRLKVRHWETSSSKGTSVDIDADAVGHDLLWGTSEFHKDDAGSAGTPSAMTEWDVKQPGQQTADAWSTPMSTSAGAAASEPQPVLVPAAEPELAYAAEETPF